MPTADTSGSHPVVAPDDREPGSRNCTTRLRQSILVEKYGGQAGAIVQDAAIGADAFDIYTRSPDGGANPYYPFVSRMDWLVARWAKLRGPGANAMTELLSLPGVRSYPVAQPDRY